MERERIKFSAVTISIVIQFFISHFLYYLGFSLQTVEALENLIPIIDTPSSLCYANIIQRVVPLDLGDMDSIDLFTIEV